MNTLLKVALSSSLLLLTSNAMAAKPMSENQKLTQCKALASTQFENVNKVKTVKIKNTRSSFKAKFKVIGTEDRGIFLCTIAKGQDAQIARVDKKSTEAIAAN